MSSILIEFDKQFSTLLQYEWKGTNSYFLKDSRISESQLLQIMRIIYKQTTLLYLSAPELQALWRFTCELSLAQTQENIVTYLQREGNYLQKVAIFECVIASRAQSGNYRAEANEIYSCRIIFQRRKNQTALCCAFPGAKIQFDCSGCLEIGEQNEIQIIKEIVFSADQGQLQFAQGKIFQFAAITLT